VRTRPGRQLNILTLCMHTTALSGSKSESLVPCYQEAPCCVTQFAEVVGMNSKLRHDKHVQFQVWDEQRYRQEITQSGTVLFHQGAPASDVVLLRSGAVKLVRMESNGLATIISVCASPDILGSSDVILGDQYSVSALALDRCCLTRLPKQQFLRMAYTKPECIRQLCYVHSQNLHETIARISGMACFSGRRRVEQLILRLMQSENPSSGRKARVRFPLKEHEVAQLLSITPEHFSRLLSRMVREGILSRERGWIVVARPDKLTETDIHVVP